MCWQTLSTSRPPPFARVAAAAAVAAAATATVDTPHARERAATLSSHSRIFSRNRVVVTLGKIRGRVPGAESEMDEARRGSDEGEISADAFCARYSRQVHNARRARSSGRRKMRKNYDLCGTCRHADGSRWAAVSCVRYRGRDCIKRATGRRTQKDFIYGERVRAVRAAYLPMLKVKARSALFYSYPDYHRKSSGAKIRFVYGDTRIGEIEENAISLSAYAPRSARLRSRLRRFLVK